MRISIIGPNTPIPPKGWGAVESLIWDYKLSLEKLGHTVQIINIGEPMKILNMMNLMMKLHMLLLIEILKCLNF